MVTQEQLHGSNLDKEIFEKDGEKEIDPKILVERKSRLQVDLSKELEFEEEERQQIEAEAERIRKETEREKKKRLKRKKRQNTLRKLNERKESERNYETEESNEILYAYNFMYYGEDEEEEEGEDKTDVDDEEKQKKENEEEIVVQKKKKWQRSMKKPIDIGHFKSSLKKKKEFLGEYLETEEECEEEYQGEDFDYYIVISDSTSSISVLSAISFEWENKVYEFEELCDPGTIDNIYQKYCIIPEYHDNIGRFRYLAICKNLNVVPITRFVEALENSEIDLSLQAFDRNSVRAICAALEGNTYVKKLDLRCNKLSPEDCHYLGLTLKNNDTLLELNLTGCRIGPEGVKKLVEFLPQNQTLEVLNLSKCNIEDEGMIALSQALNGNNSIQVLDLSYNKLSEESAPALSRAIQFNNSITKLNLRYNYLFSPSALKELFLALTGNEYITNLNLSWNGLSGKDIGSYVGNYLKKNRTIQELDLSENRFQGSSVKEIRKGLSKSTTLEILKLGKNPATAEDLEVLLAGAIGCSTLNLLDLEELWVEKSFMKTLEKIRTTRNLEVILGGINGNYVIKGPDYPAVLLKRAEYEAKKPKRKKLKKDFGHLIWTLGDEPLTVNEFMEKVRKFKAKINKELFPELIEQFRIPDRNLIDVVALKAKYLSIFPNSTPPPPKKTKLKGKKGKKMKEMKEAVETKIKRFSATKVTFFDEGKKHRVTPLLKVPVVETQEEQSEEEIEGEGGFVFRNLVIEPWTSSEDEGELFNYDTEEESECEEKLSENENENENENEKKKEKENENEKKKEKENENENKKEKENENEKKKEKENENEKEEEKENENEKEEENENEKEKEEEKESNIYSFNKFVEDTELIRESKSKVQFLKDHIINEIE